jgi:uncharacterized protein
MRSLFTPSILSFIFSLGGFSLALEAKVIVPELQSPVIDQAQLYSASERTQLEAQIRSVYPKLQLQVWTIPSLEGEAIESLSIRATDQWKLGQGENDNGLLILIAPADRQMRLEVGQGLEGAIPDAIAARIIREILTPAFREGLFFVGTQNALQQVIGLSAGERFFAQPAKSVGPRSPVSWFEKLLSAGLPLIIFFLIFITNLFRAQSRGMRAGSRRSPSIGYWGGGGGFGGGFGGGGGWSGGGGGFSGGGSSGRW